MSKLNSSPNQDALSRAIERVNGNKPSTVEDVINVLTKQTKSKDIISNSKPKKHRKTPTAKSEIEEPEHIPAIDHLPEIPDGFPEDTVLNDDGTLTLPDGRIIRKKAQEVDHEEVS